MTLYLTAQTQIPDVVIDFIEVKLRSGKEVSLSWDESGIDRTETGFSARYKGVYFDEEYANGKLDQLRDAKIIDIQLYSEADMTGAVVLESMIFTDNERTLSIDGLESIKFIM